MPANDHGRRSDNLSDTTPKIMTLGEFMRDAVAKYYAARDPFGTQGDFTTAPEISQMFGEMIGVWIADIRQKMRWPALDIIEFGPGRGTLMSDILRVVPDANAYLIETSPVLKEKQKTTVPHAIWLESLEDIPTQNPSIILGNEFLDALPIEQLMRTDKGWQQRIVKNSQFDWQPADKELPAHLPQKTESNVIYEVSPERIRFIQSCEEYLKKTYGASLFIDYGHTKSHHGETLQAVKNHQYVDIFEPASDITAHVDFDALQRALQTPSHITTQRQFLLSLGIEHRAAALSQKQNVSADLNRLIAPDQMGELFKVICFHHGINTKPAGF